MDLFTADTDLDPAPVAVSALPLAVEGIHPGMPELASAQVALVDACPDPELALRVAAALHAAHPALPIMALACCPHLLAAPELTALGQAGVRGLLDLDGDQAELLDAVLGAARGNVGPDLDQERARSIALAAKPREVTSTDRHAPGLLTPREEAVLQALLHGRSEREILAAQHVSWSTLKRVVRELKHKLGATNLVQIGSRATALGFEADQRAAE
jgi:DNA-binding NarL/FixJ family response regulator